MSLLVLHYLCLATLLSLYLASCTTTDDGEPKKTFPFRRAIDGTRGRKFYNPEEDGYQHNYGSSGRYDPDHQINDFSDIRNNVPGEPGIDYPSYTRLPETGFVCEPEFRGYYADEAAGCQMFHVCDASFLVSSFLCPVGSIFSQKLLTCDWWSKVDCSQTRSYHVINSQSLVSEADDDEILRKAFEMTSVRSAGERIPAETVSEPHQPERQDRHHRVLNYGSSAVTERTNDLQTGPENYSDYPDYFGRGQSGRYQSRSGPRSRQRYQEDDYYSQDVEDDDEKQQRTSKSPDKRNDRTFRNEFQPSYAPTVPTVITTTRRFYSPTFPTTYRPSTEREIPRGRFDLEFESSDHLYSARGRSDDIVKPATAPSVVSSNVVVTTSKDHISLPIVVNGADERKNKFANIHESESSHHRTTVTLPSVRIDSAVFQSSTESVASNDRHDDTPKIEETYSILTIDNENRNPDIFAYNRDEDASTANDTSVDISSALVEKNSTRISNPEAHDKRGKIAAFLQPPPEVANQFRITVLAESSTPRSHREFSKSEGGEENKSASGVEIVQSIELPATRITPPLIDEATKESRVIRIFVNKDNSSSSTFGSIKTESSTKKILSDDSVPLAEDNEGEHSETKIISKELPKEQEQVAKVEIEEKNSTSDAETERKTTTVSSDNVTIKTPELENPLSAGEINAAATLEKVELSSADSEEEKTEPGEKPHDIPVNSTATVSEKRESNSGDETTSEKVIVSQANNKEQHSSDSEKILNDKTAIAREKTDEQSNSSEEVLLNAKTIFENENSGDYKKSQEILLTANMTVAEEKTNENLEPSIGGSIILSDAGETEPKEKTTVYHGNSTSSEKTALIRETEDPVGKINRTEQEHSIGDEEKSLPAITKDIDKNHERTSDSGDAIEDTMVEGSSPFEVTLTVNKDEEFDPNGDLIRRLIAQQEIGDTVGAADYRNFEIVKSHGPEASTNDPKDGVPVADSRNGRRIDLDRNIDEDTLSNFRSNSFPSQNYHRSLVALVNGPNVPRPFSLEPPHNVEVRTPSDNGDTGASTSDPLVSGVFRNNLVPATTRVPAQAAAAAARQSIAASLQESEPSEKSSGPSKVELSSNDERVLDQLTFRDRQVTGSKEKLLFELPQELRSFDFITGQPAGISQQPNSRADEASENLSRTTPKTTAEFSAKSFVETEFIPSISFSLNSDAEREKYMEAVMKGLFSDVRPTESTKNDTDAGEES